MKPRLSGDGALATQQEQQILSTCSTAMVGERNNRRWSWRFVAAYVALSTNYTKARRAAH